MPVSGDSVIIPGGTPNNATLSNATLSGETITLEGSGNSSPLVVFNNVTLDSVLQSATPDRCRSAARLTVGAQGTLEADANATLTMSGTAETIVNDGLIARRGGRVSADLQWAIDRDGSRQPDQ